MLEIGSLIDGKYKILNKIGQGGMSVVYLAMNERANKQWAIKEVRKDGKQDFETVRQNLVAETDILKKLNHAHLPSIIDVIDREDSFLIVMDYIEGRPLSDKLKKGGAQPQELVIEWGKQICDVLGYLHSREKPIIYRDMKPSNVMLKPDGNIVIIDFGTAREYKSSSIEDTTCLGTQGYAAPEQYGGHGQTDARTDIYCLGATLYHLVTGHNPCLPPYEIRPIRLWNPQLSSGLESIILKCTQKDPANRYQSCAELMYALDHYSELDDEYKKKQNNRLRIFGASVVIAALSACSALGFHFMERSAVNNSYDSYINYGASSEGDTQIQYYKDAIGLDATNGTAYFDLLDKAFLKDGKFDPEEADTMTKILSQTANGTRSNQSYLEGNKEDFDEFCFRMGLAYYYYYGENGNGSKPLSQIWFEQAARSETLESQKVERAKRLAKIASYYLQLNAADKAGDSAVSYLDYWNDLTELVQGNLVSMDNAKTALVMYQEAAYQIGVNALRFKDEGVSKDALLSQLKDIKSRLDSDFKAVKKQYEKEIADVIKTINSATESVERAYSEVEANLTNGNGGK